MILYFNIALSFAIASLFFIHRRALSMYNVENTIIKDLVWVIFCTIFFPLIVLAWVVSQDKFIRTYGEGYAEASSD